MARIRSTGQTYTKVSVNTVLDATHQTVGINALANTVQLTLPLAADDTFAYTLEVESNVFAITVILTGADTISDILTFSAGKSYELQSDGVSEWKVVGVSNAGSGADTLAATLVAGNTTGGTNIVMPFGDVITEAAGGATLNVAANALGGTYDLTTDSGGYAESWIYGDNTTAQIGFNRGVSPTLSIYATGWDVNAVQSGDKVGFYMNSGQIAYTRDMTAAAPIGGRIIALQDVTTTLATSAGGPNQAVFVNVGSGSTIAVGLDNTVVASGTGIAAKTSNTLYANQASLQLNGVTFDTVITPSTATADRTATLQDASGTIAYLSDINTPPYRAITATDIFSATDGTINATSGTYTVNLPTAVGIAGRIYRLKNSGAGTITLDPITTQTIDGSATKVLAQYDAVTVQSDGANWMIL